MSNIWDITYYAFHDQLKRMGWRDQFNINNQAAMAGGVLGGLFAFALTVGIIYYILYIIAGWKLFEKAGEQGWKALIPIYNSYIYYKIVGMKKWFWAVLIVSFVKSDIKLPPLQFPLTTPEA